MSRSLDIGVRQCWPGLTSHTWCPWSTPWEETWTHCTADQWHHASCSLTPVQLETKMMQHFWCLVRGQDRFTTAMMHPLWCLLTGLCSLCIIFIFLNGVKQTVTSIMDTNLHPGCHSVQCLPTVWVSNDGLGNTQNLLFLCFTKLSINWSHDLFGWTVTFWRLHSNCCTGKNVFTIHLILIDNVFSSP